MAGIDYHIKPGLINANNCRFRMVIVEECTK